MKECKDKVTFIFFLHPIGLMPFSTACPFIPGFYFILPHPVLLRATMHEKFEAEEKTANLI